MVCGGTYVGRGWRKECWVSTVLFYCERFDADICLASEVHGVRSGKRNSVQIYLARWTWSQQTSLLWRMASLPLPRRTHRNQGGEIESILYGGAFSYRAFSNDTTRIPGRLHTTQCAQRLAGMNKPQILVYALSSWSRPCTAYRLRYRPCHQMENALVRRGHHVFCYRSSQLLATTRTLLVLLRYHQGREQALSASDGQHTAPARRPTQAPPPSTVH